ncbi:pentatricopeptide repeat-containing protein At2g22410, mitochondrial [Aristolochia californica]|uniref:pentatricopeptide repeat-containing protein At2g22410, mitochondrial n=1 Tax=Aristolochia californica TaxID=171875 RepID=UPI0035DDD244
MIFLFLPALRAACHFSSVHSPTFSDSCKNLYLSNRFLHLLQKCSSMKHLKQIQAQMLATGAALDPHAASQLIAVCASSLNRDYSLTVLTQMTNPNTYSYNVVVKAFLDSGSPKTAILLYKELILTGIVPDNYTYPLIFKACSRLPAIETAYQVFGHVLQLGFESHLFVHNAVINVFASSGELEYARQVFEDEHVRDVVSWNSMIKGCVRSRKFEEALKLFSEMLRESVTPDDVTMMGIISCCAHINNLKLGTEYHRYIKETGLNFTIPLYNAVMDMYVKCGRLDSARQLFDEMPERTVASWTTLIVGYLKLGRLNVSRELFNKVPERDIVMWNAVIAGYVQLRRGKEALSLFHEMQSSSIKPNAVTMVSLLSACALLGALDIGLWAHHYIDLHGIPLSVELGTALVDMYAKCGNIRKATEVFEDMLERNSLTWTAMIGGLAMHGLGRDAINYFHKMIDIGLKPDEVTFIEVLSACCHTGLVEEGRLLFNQMSSEFQLSPKIKHYSCMVDLLGRSGLLNEAESLIKSMPMKPDAVIWGALFFASRIHGNFAMGERAASQLLELDPDDSGIYVLLSNMYVEANMRQEADKVREMMRERGLEKTPGCSSIEINGVVYEFTVRDKSHQQREQIYECLIKLARQTELSKHLSSDYDVLAI